MLTSGRVSIGPRDWRGLSRGSQGSDRRRIPRVSIGPRDWRGLSHELTTSRQTPCLTRFNRAARLARLVARSCSCQGSTTAGRVSIGPRDWRGLSPETRKNDRHIADPSGNVSIGPRDWRGLSRRDRQIQLSVGTPSFNRAARLARLVAFCSCRSSIRPVLVSIGPRDWRGLSRVLRLYLRRRYGSLYVSIGPRDWRGLSHLRLTGDISVWDRGRLPVSIGPRDWRGLSRYPAVVGESGGLVSIGPRDWRGLSRVVPEATGRRIPGVSIGPRDWRGLSPWSAATAKVARNCDGATLEFQ